MFIPFKSLSLTSVQHGIYEMGTSVYVDDTTCSINSSLQTRLDILLFDGLRRLSISVSEFPTWYLSMQNKREMDGWMNEWTLRFGTRQEAGNCKYGDEPSVRCTSSYPNLSNKHATA